MNEAVTCDVINQGDRHISIHPHNVAPQRVHLRSWSGITQGGVLGPGVREEGTPEGGGQVLRLQGWHWLQQQYRLFHSLVPGKLEWNFRYVIFKWILVIDGWGISCEIALLWMSLDFTDDHSTLVQVIAWCRQATSHYLSQCWPRSLSPYGVTRPE